LSLIIGIRCIDGIVVAADSAATFGSMGHSTIRQTAKKIKRPVDQVICGIAGTAGLGQQFIGCLRDLWEADIFKDISRHDAMRRIGKEFFQYSQPLIEAASTAKDLFGRVAWEEAVGHAIIAMPLKDGPALFWFNEMCTPEEVTDDLPFVSIGSGRMIADPFLAFIKRVIWSDQTPTLSVGLLSAVWTLNHAIETNAGGVAKPMQVVTLKMDADGPLIDEIDQDRLRVYQEHVEVAEARVASVRDLLEIKEPSVDQGDQGTAPIPKMEQPGPDQD
jgi:20S proteasome alpha/beta subunit